MPQAEYRKDFTADENLEFDELLAHDPAPYEMPLVAGTTPEMLSEGARRALQYERVGQHIAEVCQVLIALWDGVSSASIGGTAQIVAYRLNGHVGIPEDRKRLLDPPIRGSVYHVWTPRSSSPETVGTVGRLDVLSCLDGNRAETALQDLCTRVDRFNADCVRVSVPTERQRDGTEGAIQKLASQVAVSYQTTSLQATRAIFSYAAGSAVLLALGHADHPEYAFVLIAFCLSVAAYVRYRQANSAELKDRAIEYRTLAMGLKIQQLWDESGVPEIAADHFLRIQRSECDWIRQALLTLHHVAVKPAADPGRAFDVVRAFVDDQLAFFKKNAKRDNGFAEAFEKRENSAFAIGLAASVLLFVISAGQLIFGPLDPSSGPFGVVFEHGDWCIRAIAIMTVLAAAFHEYSRSRAFKGQARRYNAMIPTYTRALDVLDNALPRIDDRLPLVREVALAIGIEALAENSQWLLMHRDLPIEAMHV
jgi:hypothetical protein